jgi:hypothetical protein
MRQLRSGFRGDPTPRGLRCISQGTVDLVEIQIIRQRSVRGAGRTKITQLCRSLSFDGSQTGAEAASVPGACTSGQLPGSDEATEAVPHLNSANGSAWKLHHFPAPLNAAPTSKPVKRTAGWQLAAPASAAPKPTLLLITSAVIKQVRAPPADPGLYLARGGPLHALVGRCGGAPPVAACSFRHEFCSEAHDSSARGSATPTTRRGRAPCPGRARCARRVLAPLPHGSFPGRPADAEPPAPQ